MSLRHVTSELLMPLKDLWTNCALVTIRCSLYFKSLIHLNLLLFFLKRTLNTFDFENLGRDLCRCLIWLNFHARFESQDLLVKLNQLVLHRFCDAQLLLVRVKIGFRLVLEKRNICLKIEVLTEFESSDPLNFLTAFEVIKLLSGIEDSRL